MYEITMKVNAEGEIEVSAIDCEGGCPYPVATGTLSEDSNNATIELDCHGGDFERRDLAFESLREAALALAPFIRLVGQVTIEHKSDIVLDACYVCGKSSRYDSDTPYFSDERTDTGDFRDVALVLCQACAQKGEAMPDAEALAFYRAGQHWKGRDFSK